jgi:poly(3-hydroxybutyrate) depolymerase
MRLLFWLLAGLGASQPLPRLNITLSQITVAGVSSGGAMATQVHVSFSKSLLGAGVIAAPPYWCAEFDISIALTACTTQAELIDLKVLIDATLAAAKVNSIDPPENLKQARVFLWSGLKDTVVASSVVQKTWAFYSNWAPASQNVYVNNVPAEHSWVTDTFGQNCAQLGTPYINNCSVDMSGLMLQHLYSNSLQPRGEQIANNLFSFSQEPYVADAWTLKLMSMGPVGSIYVPTGCQRGKFCKLIVVFHGCEQGFLEVGDVFVRHSGLNEWAETNDIVVLYPQAIQSNTIPYNPKGCWDWWGYTGADYACKLGAQVATIRNMIRAVAGTFDEPSVE